MDNEFISLVTERIVRDFDPLQIILFGSQARGDAHPDSDIDLLVVFSELEDKRETAVDIQGALADVPVPKDILVSTPEELVRHRTRIGSVLRYAQQEGKILCQKISNGTDYGMPPNKEITDAMQEADRLEDTARWLRYAEEDLITAERLLSQSDIAPRQSYYLAQQSAEKALKAALIFLQIDFRRTHNLNVLRDLFPKSWQLKTDLPNLDPLNEWVVEARYPERVQDATRADASQAVELARAVWTSVSTELAHHGYRAEKEE